MPGLVVSCGAQALSPANPENGGWIGFQTQQRRWPPAWAKTRASIDRETIAP